MNPRPALTRAPTKRLPAVRGVSFAEAERTRRTATEHGRIRSHQTGETPIEAVLDDVRSGCMVVVIGDVDEWDGEGALILPATRMTAQAITFLAVLARGIICLPMLNRRVEELGLSLQARPLFLLS